MKTLTFDIQARNNSLQFCHREYIFEISYFCQPLFEGNFTITPA